MLESKDYLEIIENLLNANSYGKVFKLYSDIGNYKEALKGANTISGGILSSSNTINYVVNGIFSLAPSTLVPIKNLSMSTINADIEFAINIDRIPPTIDADGNVIDYPEVSIVREIWDTVAQANNGSTTTLTDGAGNTFAVSLEFSLGNVGLVAMETSDSGEVLPISASVVFTTIENGMNSNDADLIINGEKIFTSQMVVTRNRLADNVQHTNKKSTYTTVLQNGLGVDFTAPLLSTTIGNMVAQDVLKGGNHRQLMVVLKINSSNSNAYVMTFGSNIATITAGNNIGANISLVELDPIFIQAETNWVIGSDASTTAGATRGLTGTFGVGSIIKWSDTEYEILTQETTNPTHTMAEAYSGRSYGYKVVSNG